MLQNYLKIAWRNLLRYKGFTLINVVGLTLGIAFALLIGLWVQDEWSYNRFHANLEDLHFVRTNAKWGGIQTWETTPGPLAEAMRTEVPEIKSAARMTWGDEVLLTVGEQNLKPEGLYADPEILTMFSFPVLEGNPATAMDAPDDIVLTKSLAEKLFGFENPIGQSVTMNKEEVFTVSAVVEDVPTQSEIQFAWLAPWQTYVKDRSWVKNWGNANIRTYVQLQPGVEVAAANDKIAFLGKAREEKMEFFLQPFSETYLYSKWTAGVQDGGRIEYVRLFSAIAIFLLIIACINFMNLATARSSRRAREIGIRKVVGASRSSLMRQFMGEALLLAVLSLFLAVMLAQAGLTWFNELFGKEIAIDYGDPLFWGAALGLALLVGLLAGSYPAVLLSSLKPVKILKGDILKVGDNSAWLRKGLVVFQFAISVFLIVGTLVIHRQIAFVMNKNLGYDRQDLFYTFLEGELHAKQETFRQELEASPLIQSVTFTGNNPMNLQSSSDGLKWPGMAPDEQMLVAAMAVGDGFTKTMGIELVAGRDFSGDRPADTSNYIVNQATVEAIGLEDPIGTEVEFWNGKGTIIGVTRDYHLNSLHVAIRPMVLAYAPENTWIVWVKPAAGKTQEALAYTQAVAEKLNPGYPFQPRFADEEFARQYQSETLTGKLANVFAGIAILISCLGLFGLAAYSVERRRKEIGIRKVLGASVSSIIELLSVDFLKLIFLSFLVALPAGWYFTQQWLRGFAYRIDFEWWIFAAAGLAAITISAVTISGQAIRAATGNPVEAIKEE
jgi:putative ABC transport system permease protein